MDHTKLTDIDMQPNNHVVRKERGIAAQVYIGLVKDELLIRISSAMSLTAICEHTENL